METLYIGTNTDLGGKGIYSVPLPSMGNPSDLTLGHRAPALRAETGNPSYLVWSGKHKLLYVVSENAEGSISVYSDGKSGLTLESRVETKTAGLVHLALDRRERFVFAASYEDACVQAFRLGGAGRAIEKTFEARHEGSGPNADRQDRAHAHSVWLTPTENELCVCDLGTDSLVVYGIDYKRGTLTRRENRRVAFEPGGAGPRHLAFHPNGRWSYVLGELDCRLYVFSWSEKGGFSWLQTVNLVDTPAPVSTAAAIRISRDGRFLYVSVRGEDLIVCHTIRRDGTLAERKTVSSLGAHPRDFILSPLEDRLYCANRDSNAIACFDRNKNTGALDILGTIEGVPSPIAVLFG